MNLFLEQRSNFFYSSFSLLLIGSLLIRFSSIFNCPPYNAFIAVFLASVVGCCVAVVFFQKSLKTFLFLFGFSFFLYGSGAIDIQSRIFEIIVTSVATALLIINYRQKKKFKVNRYLFLLLICYALLSALSLLLLPLRQILRDFTFFGVPDAFYYLFIDPPYSIGYPVSAVIRLVLFVVLILQLSGSADSNSRESYKSLFSGIFAGAVFCAFIGLLDFYGVISLAWYRFGVTGDVLQSVFLNRGWFAEFVLSVVPFVLIGFISKTRGYWFKTLLFAALVICETSLILAGARAGWVSYPLILFICWLFFYFSKEGRLESFKFGWRGLVKVVVSLPITIVISVLLIFYVLMPLSDCRKNQGNMKGISRNSRDTGVYLKYQAGRIVKPSPGGRLYTWGEGFNVGRESPLFGMGYESFCWHANILSKIKDSHANKFYKESESKFIHQTPHSIFYQVFVSGGIAGLFLWVILIGYALFILLVDLINNRHMLNIPVIISIISFHIYGIFQSMQYIPMIWLLIFLNLGYAMTINESVLPVRARKGLSALAVVAVVLVVIGGMVYLWNFESRNLAKKYGLRIYAMDQNRDRFAGFFQHSKRWKYGDYRWSGKRGAVYVPNGGTIELDFRCQTPDAEKEPVVLSVFHDGSLLDRVLFSKSKKETVRRKYSLTETPGEEQELLIDVSRTWNPHKHLGNYDRRNLGVGVAIARK